MLLLTNKWRERFLKLRDDLPNSKDTVINTSRRLKGRQGVRVKLMEDDFGKAWICFDDCSAE